MSEPRKNHLAIDGGQVKEDDHVASYKAVPESDSEFRPLRSTLTKSKEKLSPDGAEEKLLQKEDEARITTRVDMADAKYVVGDHRNGDAKIELDANKRQFSGLTKEELLRYAEDPFWIRLRWIMFVAFWALWVCMLAGAIGIIVKAPKCAPPPAKTWFEIGPLADMSSSNYEELEAELPLLEAAQVQAVFMTPCPSMYEVLDTPTCLDNFKAFLEKAKKHSVKVIVDLTANFVSTGHQWFKLSENRSEEFDNYFVWANGKDADADGLPQPPNNWVSTLNEPAWTQSEVRKQYYLHQYSSERADLNMNNPAVVRRVDAALAAWLRAGAAGVRLQHARQLVVNSSLTDDSLASGHGADKSATINEYKFWRHKQTSDQPELDGLLAHWSHIVATGSSEDTVFTIAEDGTLSPEWYLLRRNTSALRPPSAAPVALEGDVTALAATINKHLGKWPAMQLKAATADGEEEVAILSLLLPAAPVFGAIRAPDNESIASESLAHLVSLRSDASVQHGHHAVAAVPANNSTDKLLACARWKAGHSGYAVVYNAGEAEQRANLTALPSLPASLTVHHLTHRVKAYTNYTNSMSLPTEDILVPGYSSILLSYVPKTTAEK